jgi:hypothetical protein
VMVKWISLEILMDLHIFRAPAFEKVVCGRSCSSASMVVQLASTECLDRFYSYLVFKTLTFIGRLPGGWAFRLQKQVLQMNPKTENSDFLEDSSVDFD